MNRTHPATARTSALCALIVGALATLAAAQADDMAGSNMVVDFDFPTAFGALGAFQSNDKDGYDGINNDFSLPTMTLSIPGSNWRFEIMHYVFGWNTDGARSVQVGIRGDHLVGPHTDDDPTNILPEIWCRSQSIPWGQTRLAAVSTTIEHPGAGHQDFYGVSALTEAVDADPVNNTPRHVRADDPRNPAIVLAKHGEKGRGFWPDFNTAGSSPVKGTGARYDPDTSTLTLEIGQTDILDGQGGRTGTVDPVFGDDPALLVQTEIVELRLAGFDEVTGEYLFDGGPYHSANPDGGFEIDGRLGAFRIGSSLPGESMGAFGPFALLSVIDGVSEDGLPTRWSQGFVETGWFGRGLPDQERNAIVYPVLSFTTDIDIVEATDGFTREAALPATVLLTIATDPAAPCPADLNGDGVVNTLDVLAFLNAWSAGSDTADWNHDGQVNTLDVLGYLNDWNAGCGDN